MTVKNSDIVESQFPKYLLRNRELVAFLKNYYKWTEADGNFQDVADRLANNFFVDYADTDFIEFFVSSILPSFPTDTVIDRDLLLKNALEFYRSKGSIRSIEFLLRAVYGVDSTIYFPKEDIFRLSNTKFGNVLTMTIGTIIDPEYAKMQSRRIRGASSGATAVVDVVTAGSPTATITVQDLVGTFTIGETIYTMGDTDVVFATVTTLPVASTVITGDDSMASGTKKLQDGEYYQEFSYVVRTSIPDTTYGTVVDKLAHPIGTKRIGEVV
jgi:hypothetical protein